jgi:2'-hydroxyisoflavone reductase
MKLLILGGTVFLGRALVEAALPRGHQVTLFNRGKTNPGLFPEVEKITGERDSDLSVLQDRGWDAVIDTCGYIPRLVRRSAEALADKVGHYTFISSLSVYADPSQMGIDESAPVGTLDDPLVEEVNGDTYGPLKALCEQAAESAMPGRALVVRPGLIVGPYDPTDRFTYWPHRIAQGGEVLAPGRPGRAVQFIDVRDLAEWTLGMVEKGKTGTYNADGPAEPMAMEELLKACKTESSSDAAFTWVSEAFLLEQEVGMWMEMPLWVPESQPEHAGFFAFDCRKAIAEGLSFRPLAETVRATLDWDASLPPDRALRAGITRKREIELLAKWKEISPSNFS